MILVYWRVWKYIWDYSTLEFVCACGQPRLIFHQTESFFLHVSIIQGHLIVYPFKKTLGKPMHLFLRKNKANIFTAFEMFALRHFLAKQ